LSGVRIQLLGGVAAVSDHGEPVDVGPVKCQALLAGLALSVGRPVPVWQLVDAVWGAAPPRTAERTLQSYATRLRKCLGTAAIARSGVAYRLDLPADAVDVCRFERRLDAGELDAALAEWTGEPLAGLEAPGLTASVDALVERWLGAMEADLERRVEVDPAAAIATLTELTALHPFREGLWALLMTALYRVGRQADALSAYRTARERLVEQLGVEPGPQLRELERLVLGHDARLEAAEARGNLPRRSTRLIGRDEDLDRVTRTLDASPVVTLVGHGGVGKTRLALAAAERFAGETWLVELAEITEADDVARAVADTLGVKEHPGRTLAASLAAALGSRPALLILDNCEHVLEGVAAVAAGARVLATSREPLRVPGEQILEIGPLDPAAGVELFNERAAAVCPEFDPDADRDSVEVVCQRLDGVPLAIELAAARVRSLAPAELVDRLGLRLLTAGSRTGPAHHRTLRATIAWSYDLLTPAEQRLLARLSAFAGPFDLTAAEAIADDPAAPLADLVDRSLVLVEGRRFRLLDTVREFAVERLHDDGATEAAGARHACWCKDEVVRIGALLAGPDEVEGVRRLAELWPNLRAAFERACGADDVELARSLVRPIVAEVLLRSRHEIGDWLERLLAIAPPGDDQTRAFCLAWCAHRYAIAHDPDGYDRLAAHHGEPDHPVVAHGRAFAHEDYEALLRTAPAAIAERRRHGEHDLAEHAEVDVGAALMNLGRLTDCDAVVTALADRYRAQGPPTLLNWTLLLLGYSAKFQADHDRAERLFEEAVAVEVPERTYTPNTAIRARLAFRRGDRPQAFRLLRAYVGELLSTDNMQGASVASEELAEMIGDRAPAGNDRRALEEMARVLDELVGAPATGAASPRPD
jgi:predicted ATPase/DNA-binding SARP family transcriptional activator